MDLNQNLVAELAQKYIDGTASYEEKQKLHEWYNTVNAGDTEIVLTPLPQTAEAFRDEMFAELKQWINQADTVQNEPARVRRIWWKWAAAALMIALLGTVIWLLLLYKGSQPDNKQQQMADVKAPVSLQAVLTLQNGKQILLDSVQNGQLARQGNTSVSMQSGGKIIYDANNTGQREIVYNTLTVPRGSRIVHLQLSDGTTVVLNTASSITYPTAFTEQERRVTITGEVYFEVTKDPSKKFLVTAGEVTTEVLGTQFNVNAYEDEDSLRVTLVEGKVKTSLQNGKWSILKPGEQASISAQDQKAGRIQVQPVDVEDVLAWKNGWFQFSSITVQDIMRQISRWYNVEVVYEESSNKTFTGIVNRNDNVSEVLKMMEQAGIKFRIEGNKITVLK